MAKTYIARPGQKVTIEINRPTATPRRNPQNPKGLIQSRKPDDYPARRLKKTLRIFDAGRDSSGADFTGFIIQPPFLPAIEDGLPVATLAEYAARDEYLFDRDGATLFDKFYEITRDDGDLYRLTLESDDGSETLDSDSDYWTDKGIKLPSDIVRGENLVVYANSTGGRAFRLNFFKLAGFNDSYKITSEYDYDGDGITDFRLKGGDALFMMPEICRYRATTLAFGVTHHLNYDFRLGLREYYAEDFAPAIDPGEDTGTTDWGERYYAVAFHVALEDARAMRVEFDFDLGEYVYTEVPAEHALSDPPFNPTTPPVGSTALTMQIVFNGFLSGTLAAIVKRGSQTFYIWQD